ncbi:MAG: YdcF family protein [Opitutaceae bacterium]|nr:YdcF family protein [Opitutaceae bacterium]
MGFVLKKLIGFALLPLTVSLVLLILGTVLSLRERWKRWGRRLSLAGLVWLVIVSNRGVGTTLVGLLERQYPPQAEALVGPVRDCRVILVLGAGHADNTAMSATNRLSSSALARVTEGVRIARMLPGSQLWVSGPGANDQLATHASVLAAAARSLGLPAERLTELTAGRDTEGEAQAVRLRLKPNETVALVTSAWHMPRAVALFRKAGVSVIPCPTDYASRWNDDFRWSDSLAWDLSGLERTTKAIYEFLGLSWSKLTGRI